MIQVSVEGVFIDLYQNDTPKLTLSIEDIVTTQTTTNYTKEFRVPATAHNYNLFQTLFDINGEDFDVSLERNAYILVNGQEFVTGNIRLNNIYKNELNNKYDYGIIFIGVIRNIAGELGQKTICELDFSNFSHNLNITTLQTSWQAYPEGSLTDGLFNGSIIYPLVDFGNTYNSDLVPQQTTITRGSGIHFTNPNEPMDISYFRPCIRAKDIWDKIFDTLDYTYTSNFLNSNLFRHLYVGAWGDEAQVTIQQNAFAGYSTFTGPFIGASQFGVEKKLPLDTATNNIEDFDFVNDFYVVPQNGSYTITQRVSTRSFWIDPEDPTIKNVTLRYRIYLNGNPTPIAEAIDVVSQVQTGNNTFSHNSLAVSSTFNAGDEIYTTLEVIAYNECSFIALQPGGNFQEPTQLSIFQDVSYNVGNSLSCNYEQIQFIRDIVTKFRLVITADKDDPNNLIIEPWKNYIGSGDIYDWTEKLDLSKDIVLKPLFLEQKNKIDFVDKVGKDFLNVENENQLDEVYGTLKVRANNRLLKDERKIETKFVPVAVKQIRGAAEVTNGMDNTIIPHIYTQEVEVNDSGTPVVLKKPVVPETRLFWYDGLKHTGTISTRDANWYVTYDGTDYSYTKFPMISQFNEWGDRDDSWTGIDTQTYDLCWQRENTFIEFDLANPGLGFSVYDEFWSQYISLLYNKNSRRFTGYFILSSEDLINFKFSDVIFVRGTYYYVEKIYDFEIAQKNSVKVDLIKLIDYNPNVTPVIPGIVWDEQGELWNITEDLWNE